MYDYPKLFPLFIKSDHGVNLLYEFQAHELVQDGLPMVTWRPRKYQNGRKLGLNIHLIPHPWISWKNLNNLHQEKTASGTIIFLPHGTSDLNWNTSEVIPKVLSIREEFNNNEKFVVCLHYLDVNKGLHVELRKLKFNIVTIGFVNSINFVENFYNLIKEFKNILTFDLGSAVFYGLELGLNAKLYNIAKYSNKNSEKRFVAQDNFLKKIDLTSSNELIELLSKGLINKNNVAITGYLNDTMALNTFRYEEFRKILYNALISNYREIPDLYFRDLKKLINKNQLFKYDNNL